MEQVSGSGRLYRVASWCYRQGWLVLVLWLTALAGATIGGHALGGDYTDNLSLPASASNTGYDLLERHAPALDAVTGQVVFSVSSGTLNDHRSAIRQSMSRIGGLHHVLSAPDPLVPSSTAPDGRTAVSTLSFDISPTQLGSSFVRQVEAAVTPARADGVAVNLGGKLGEAARPPTSDTLSEAAGIVVAMIVLLLGFRRVAVVWLPILTALIGVATGLGLLHMLAAGITFGTVAPTLATMIGLGVGIDYALFLIARYQQLIGTGLPRQEASCRAAATSGRAVAVAAMTVIIALLGLYASGITFVGKLGLAACVAVATSAAAALTLYPALAGRAIRPLPRHTPRPLPRHDTAANSRWNRYAAAIARHPARYLTATAILLVLLSVPVLFAHQGIVDDGLDPAGYTDRIAYDQVTSALGPGLDAPFVIVLDVGGASAAEVAAAEAGLERDLRRAPDIASVTPVQVSSDHAIAYTMVYPRSGIGSEPTAQLLGTLRAGTLPQALAQTGVTGSVTGPTAFQLDFQQQVGSRLDLIIGAVVATAFVLLILTFRSPVLALKAALLNLLSFGASYGVLTLVFQRSWGEALLGLPRQAPIESYVPMVMFAIIFGLSMDYEVFLLSRIREHWQAHHDNQASIAYGLAATARVITCAAIIMASVFFAFLLSSNLIVKMLALGLGVSVLIDATVIRLVLVPAVMLLLGRTNWWTPAWLQARTPRAPDRPEDTRRQMPVSRSSGWPER